MLYQLGSQRIEIIVRKDSGTAEKGAKEKDTDQVADGEVQDTNLNDDNVTSGSVRNRFSRLTTKHALVVAKQVVTAWTNFGIQQIGNINGDQALQESVSRTFEMVQDVTNFASSVSSGMMAGSAGGPVGALIGGLMGAISAGTTLGIKYATRQIEFNFKTFKENNAIEYQRARASISLTTGRLR